MGGPLSHSSNISTVPETFGCVDTRLNTRIPMPPLCPSTTVHICVCKECICIHSLAQDRVSQGSSCLYARILLYFWKQTRVLRVPIKLARATSSLLFIRVKANFFHICCRETHALLNCERLAVKSSLS
jgi:hypothetical protein